MYVCCVSVYYVYAVCMCVCVHCMCKCVCTLYIMLKYHIIMPAAVKFIITVHLFPIACSVFTLTPLKTQLSVLVSRYIL